MTSLIFALSSQLFAHEIPAKVTVQAFVKPEDGRLRMLVRVPLEAMTDLEFPRRGPGYLDIGRADQALKDAATVYVAHSLEIYEEGTRLVNGRIVAVRVSLPSNRSFSNYEQALAHVTGVPLPDQTQLYWAQGMLDVLFDFPTESKDSNFSINPSWERLGFETRTVLRFLPPGSGERIFEYSGNPGLVQLDPRWYHAALTFTELGFFHILDGIDHLLFLMCLVIPFRQFWGLIPVVTSFTVAHSITLLASAFGIVPNTLWFPPLIETLIAASIVYMAFENIIGAKLHHRWLLAFGFGLVHGFGFSFVLSETLQFAGSHLLTSLLAFNLGVELGQLLVLLLTIPILSFLFRFLVAERSGILLLSVLVAHNAWHWMSERGTQLGQYQFQWPTLDVTPMETVMRWLMLLLILAGALWLLFLIFGRFGQGVEDQPPEKSSTVVGEES